MLSLNKQTTSQAWDLKTIVFLCLSLNRDDYTKKQQTKTRLLTSDRIFMCMFYFYSWKANKAVFSMNRQVFSKTLNYLSGPALLMILLLNLKHFNSYVTQKIHALVFMLHNTFHFRTLWSPSQTLLTFNSSSDKVSCSRNLLKWKVFIVCHLSLGKSILFCSL